MALITGLKGGTTNITVSYGGQTATVSNFTVNKKTVTFTVPTLKEVEPYTRSPQTLVNAGSCTTGGTMYYYVSTSSSTPTFSVSSWTTTVPSKTNAGTYYLWYCAYVSDTGAYTGTGINTVTKVGTGSVTIPKRTPVLSTSPTKKGDWSYNGTEYALASGGAMKHSSTDSTAVAGTFTYAKATNPGTYTASWSFTPTDTTNYNSTSGNVGTVTVSRADNPITISPTTATIYVHSSHTYNNTVQLSVSGAQGSVSYSSSDTGKATVNSSGLVTAKAAGTATITATADGNTYYKSGTASCTVTIVTDTYTDTWNNPSISKYSYSNIGAGGGTSTPTVTVTQSGTRTWTSGYSSQSLSNSTFNYSYSMTTGNGFSINTTNGNITADSRGTTTGSERSSNTATVTVTGSGSKSNTKTAVCKQNANALTNTNYSPSDYTASVSIGNGLTAGGGSATVTASASHKAYDYYTSGSYNNQHTVTDTARWMITSNGNSRFSHPSSGGTSLSGVGTVYNSGTAVSHSSMGTTATTDTVTVTAYNTTSTSAKATATKSITNTKDNTNYSPSDYTASVSIGNGLTAGGGSATVTASASHKAYDYYTSGSYNNQHTVTDSVTWSITTQTFTPSGGSASTITRFSKSNNTLSHTSMTSNVGTDYVKITATNSSNTSTTSTAEKSITNELGTQKYKNTSGTTGYNIVYTVPTVSIRSELSAAGGTATVTCSVTNNTNWYQKYTSGTYTSQKTSTETGTARWMITSNGNSRFSHPSSGGTSLSGVGTVYNTGTKISHSNMTTNATTDTVTVTAYNIGDISKTKTASASVSNALTGISISLGSNPINYNTTTTATVTATYTSGSSKDVTSSLSTSSSATSNYIKSGNTNIVTVS